MIRAFVDSGYFVALAIRDDQWHESAAHWSRKAERGKYALTTTWPVLLEVGNSLSKSKYRAAGAMLLDSILSDPAFTVVPLDESLLGEGMALFSEREDKEWSLTDCISFLVMSRDGISDALTSDEHFEQAGFSALLRTKEKK